VRRRRFLVALAVAACAVPGAAIAEEVRTQDNIAVAVTETDGAREFDFSWEVIRQRRGDVDSRNIANAAARCTDCRATAIAFQVVLAWGNDIGAVIPRNQAVAINDQCTRCVVYAGARQFVRLVDEPARFTDAGREVLADVRDKLRAIEYADLSVDEQIAIVEAQEARVLKVITEEVVPLAGEGSLMVEDRDDREADAD
jgi:putative peptide zinc metalloprotease protein